MRIRSVKYPSLRVHVGDGSVKFRDGFADVSDEIGAKLIELDGIETAEAETVAELDSADDADEVGNPVSAEAETDAESVKRKPGRPKKSD